MNPLIEYYKEYTAPGYKWSLTEQEYEHAHELANAATDEQKQEFDIYLKADIKGEHHEPTD